MKALIFGINGQDGFYLNKLCNQNKVEVIGISRANIEYTKGNVGDLSFVNDLIKNNKPDYIFHLAANSSTRHDALFENHETISTGSLNILESVYKYSPQSKIFFSGSGLQFVNNGKPISENDPFEAKSPYSVARIQSVYAARYYKELGVQTYIGYFFNHDSPLRSERHINQKIAMAAKRIAGGSKEIIEIGDTTVKKEFSFAGDIMKAVWILIQNDSVYECVIGSGKAHSIEEWLNVCFQYYNLDWKLFVSNNFSFKKEYDVLVSNPATIFSLGWKPALDINDLADLMLNQ